MVIKLPRFVFPASLVGTAIGVAVIIKDRSRGEKYKGEEKFAGRTAIVTGGNSGIGRATALELARRGGRVILACRDLKAAYVARDEIIEETYNKNVDVKHLDLSSLESIANFSKDVIQNEKKLDVLINNAGVMEMGNKRHLTPSGFELHLGVNYLGAFLLTNLLIPKLLHTSTSARVVNLVTISMNKADMPFDDINSTKDYDPYRAYARSKLALMSFTQQLSHRYKGKGLTTYAVYPGAVQTNLARGLSKSTISSTLINTPMSIFMRSAEEAAQSVIYCCIEPDIEQISGQCIKDMKVMKWSSDKLTADDADRLWKIAEKWTRLDSFKLSLELTNDS